MSWIVAMTRPQYEAIAGVNLTRQGFDYYCPKYLSKQANKPSSIKPLFPRYIFIFIDQFWSSILGTRGISKVLLNGDGPATLDAKIISDLKSREKNGLVQLVPPSKFQVGDKVKVSEGPLVGHVLICESMLPHERVRVLMELLGRKVPVVLDEKVLTAA